MAYRYAKIVSGDVLRDEWMNIGIMIFNIETGKLEAIKIDTTRASKSGFLRDTRPITFADMAKDYAASFPTIESVNKMHQSMGHAMSSIQIHWGGSSILESVDELMVDVFRLVQ